MTCLLAELKQGRVRVDDLEQFVKDGFDLEERDMGGCTALMIATEYKFLPIVSALLDLGANVHAKDNEGWTALHHATCIYKSEMAVPYLLDAGASVNDQDSCGGTALMYSGTTDTLEFFLREHPDLELRNDHGETCLYIYALDNRIRLLENALHRKPVVSLNKKCRLY